MEGKGHKSIEIEVNSWYESIPAYECPHIHLLECHYPDSRNSYTITLMKYSYSKYVWVCGILPHGGGLASSDRTSAHALNSGNTGLGGITLTTSQAPVTPGPRTRLRASGTIASVACSSESVVFQPTTSAKTTNKQQSVNVREVSAHRYLPP
jgi:hypothetical protein